MLGEDAAGRAGAWIEGRGCCSDDLWCALLERVDHADKTALRSLSARSNKERELDAGEVVVGEEF